MRSNLTSEVTGGHYGGRPVEAKPLDEISLKFCMYPLWPPALLLGMSNLG